jgi:hypothetical protein
MGLQGQKHAVLPTPSSLWALSIHNLFFSQSTLIDQQFQQKDLGH